MAKQHFHVISNTHWDREWRYPFQVYRMELVKMMDRLLDILETEPDYRAFFLDSQTVILEDYLEIRPENERRIKKLVKADRLQIGPWYTLPDEWGCPGEALVRNLLMGHRTGKRFGPVSKVGYTPFSNGQISQLPQIYKGFGIESCFFYRGVGKHVAKPEFIWESPDGSQVLAFRFGDYARYNYYYLMYRPGLLGRTLKDRDYIWNPDEIPFHVANETFQDRQYGWMNQRLYVHEDKIEQALEDAKKHTTPDAATSHHLFMMGHDHSFPLKEEVALIKAAQKYLKDDEELIFSSLNDYLAAFTAEANNLEVLKGEMRHTNKIGLWTNLMANILSCRLYLKQQNARVNSKVLYGSEPLAACAWNSGSEYPRAFFEIAWKKLLVNQAHDAVGGCSVDPVHQEMQARWSEVEALSDEICRNSMRDIAGRIDGSSIAPQNLQLTIFNTMPFERFGVARFIIDIPTAEKETTFSVETPEGRAVPAQIIACEDYSPTVEDPYELSMPFPVKRFTTDLYLEDIPAMGYQALIIKPGGTPLIAGENIARSPRELQNDLLNVRVNENGTIVLKDLQSGRIMDGLFLFEDEAEFGDPWNRVVPEGDVPITSAGVRAECDIVENGALTGTLRVRFSLPLPEGKGEGNARSKRLIECPIEILLTLRKDSPVLEATVRLDNRVKDHRLRILFPSGVQEAVNSAADGQFDVLERPIRSPNPEGWKEPPYRTHPMWNWVDVSDGLNGLAVVSGGLIEYEVKDDLARTIAITLLRTFGKFVFGRPTPGSQCLGEHYYRLWLYPHQGTWQDARRKIIGKHIVPLQALESAPTKGSAPMRHSCLRLSPASLVFSGVKQGEDGRSYIVRFWNSLEKSCDAIIETGLPLRQAHKLTLEEKRISKIKITDKHRIMLSVKPKEIVTVGILFDKG